MSFDPTIRSGDNRYILTQPVKVSNTSKIKIPVVSESLSQDNKKNFMVSEVACLTTLKKIKKEIQEKIHSSGFENNSENTQFIIVEQLSKWVKIHPQVVFKYFANFGIEPINTAQKIVRLVALELGRENPSLLMQSLKDFPFKDVDVLKEILMFMLDVDAGVVLQNIQGIDVNEDHILEIVQCFLSQKQPFSKTQEIAQSLKKLNFSARNFIEIGNCFLDCNLTTGFDFFKSFPNQNLEVSEIERFFSILKKVSLESVTLTCQLLNLTGIVKDHENKTSNDVLKLETVKLAFVCADINGWETSKYIKNFNIDNQTQLIKIAKRSAKQDLYSTLEYLAEYCIDPDSKDWQLFEVEMMIHCGKKLCEDEEADDSFLEDYQNKLPKELFFKGLKKLFVILKNGNLNDNYFGTLKKFLESFCSFYWKNMDIKILDEIFSDHFGRKTLVSKENVTLQKKQAIWFSYLIAHLAALRVTDQQLKSTFKVIKQALLIKDFEVRDLIAELLTTQFFVPRDDLQKPYDKYVEIYEKLKIKNAVADFYIIPMFFFSFIEGMNVDSAIYIKALKNQTKNNSLKNANFTKPFFKTMAMLLLDDETPVRQKIEIIDSLLKIQPKKIEFVKSAQEQYEDLIALKGIIEFKEMGLLKNTDLIDLQKSFKDAFAKVIPIARAEENFSVRFNEVFGSYRIPKLIMIYAATLKKLESESKPFLDSLADCIETILNNQFIQCRYTEGFKSQSMEHLNLVFKDVQLKHDWMKGSKKDLKQVFTGSDIELDDLDFKDLMIVETDSHEDLFSSGTEVEDSCLSIHRDVSHNKSLLSYVKDGKIRMVAIKNATGKIIGRAMIKLLLDQTDEKPVILLERIYPKETLDPILRKAIVLEALIKAKECKVPLICKNVEIIDDGLNLDFEISQNQIVSLSGDLFEQVDSLDDNIKDGVYDFSNYYLIKQSLR